MFKFLEGFPPDVIAVEAIGTVTHDDYRTMLIPHVEAKLAKGPVSVMLVFGKEFTGYKLEALWDDTAFGLKHWRDFARVALVTDEPWMRGAASMFTPLLPAEVRLFRVSDLAAAKAWVAGASISH